MTTNPQDVVYQAQRTDYPGPSNPLPAPAPLHPDPRDQPERGAYAERTDNPGASEPHRVPVE